MRHLAKRQEDAKQDTGLPNSEHFMYRADPFDETSAGGPRGQGNGNGEEDPTPIVIPRQPRPTRPTRGIPTSTAGMYSSIGGTTPSTKMATIEKNKS